MHLIPSLEQSTFDIPTFPNQSLVPSVLINYNLLTAYSP